MAEPTPGSRRHDHRVYAELGREARGMERGRAAERDERPPCERFAALDRMDARGIGHGLIDDFADPGRRDLACHAQRFCDVALNGLARSIPVQRHRAAGEPGGVDAPRASGRHRSP